MLEGTKDAILNVNGKTIRLGDGFGGTVKVDIKNLQGNIVNISGSNKTKASYPEKAKPTISITVNSMDAETIAEITGAPSKDGLFTNNVEVIPNVGVLAQVHRFGTDKDRVYVFPKCSGTYTTVSLATDTDSKRTMATVQLDFNALDSDVINASGGFMDVKNDDLSSVYKILGWSEPASDQGDFNSATTTTSGSQASGSPVQQ